MNMDTMNTCKKTIGLAVCFTVLLVAGCDVSSHDRGGIKPELYRCTEAQLSLVSKEFEICTKSGFLDAHCFKMAKSSQCDFIGEDENKRITGN